jgi:hypothetical protein
MVDAKLPVFGVPQGFKADPAQVSSLKARLVEAGVKSCFATFVDVYGIPKSKQTPIEAFEHMCDGSELYTVGACEAARRRMRHRSGSCERRGVAMGQDARLVQQRPLLPR